MMSSDFAGTHQFIPPEIADGKASFASCKVDVWALGVLLFNMLTGKYPFEFNGDNNLLGLYESIIKAEFIFPADSEVLDDSAQDLIRGMLTKNVDDRLDLPSILLHPWTQRIILPHNVHDSFLVYSLGESNNLDDSYQEGISTTSSPSQSSPLSPTRVTDSQQLPPPVDTTMIPYIQDLYAEEIEAGLSKSGVLGDMYIQAGPDSLFEGLRSSSLII
jgi:serine/threonine protein kinase